MRLATIDVGNTNLRVFDHHKKTFIKIAGEKDLEAFDKVIFSTVLSKQDLKKRHSFLNFNSYIDASSFVQDSHFFKMPLRYNSQELGIDRILCAYPIFCELKESDEAVIVDSGTFTTIDHVNDQGFQSGYIVPGIYAFLKSYTLGSQLPIMEVDQLLKHAKGPLQACKTKEALAKTIKITYLSLVNTFINCNKVIYTGGDAKVIEELIGIPGQHSPYLIHRGMDYLAKSL